MGLRGPQARVYGRQRSPQRLRPNSALWTSAAFLSPCCLRCGCRPAQRIVPDLHRTACTVRGRRGAVSVPVVLDLAPRERHACDLIRYFRSCTEHWSGPRAGGGLQPQGVSPGSGSLSGGSFHPVLCADTGRLLYASCALAPRNTRIALSDVCFRTSKRIETSKECGGSQICEHCPRKRRKSECKECGGSQICEHNRIRSRCKECLGSSICPHERRKSECKECGGSEKCEQDRIRSRCLGSGTDLPPQAPQERVQGKPD
jgi:hypothetical protein